MVNLDLNKLEQEEFGVKIKRGKPQAGELLGTKLLVSDVCYEILKLSAKKVEVTSPVVGCSMFVKHYARACCVSLYLMSVHNQRISISLKDIALSISGEIIIFINEKNSKKPVTRNMQRLQVLHSLFQENFAPLFNFLSSYVGIKEQILWENAFVYIRHFYQRWMEEAKSEEIATQLRQDYEWVTEQLRPKLLMEVETIAESVCFFRKTCCYRYQLPDGRCCKICPRNKV